MIRSYVLAGVVSLVLALQTSLGAAPSPVPTPKTIIRIESSPFCQVFRENVFRAVEGLRINDKVIDQGRSLLAKMAYDGVADWHGISEKGVPVQQGLTATSVEMDEYQLTQVASQAQHNLQRIYGLLNDPKGFAERPQSDADRDLASMKSALQAVADAQARSLNLLWGESETDALNDLLSRGDNMGGALGQTSIADKNLKPGDPILTSPGSPSLPAGGAVPGGSLFAGTPVGRMTAAVAISQRLTGSAEDHVYSTVLPGVGRCSAP